MIRKAAIPDIDEIIKIGREAHAQTFYRDIEFAEKKLRRMVAMMITSKRHFCEVVDVDGVEGVLLGQIGEIYFSTQKRASDLFFWVRENARARGHAAALAKSFLTWAEKQPGVVMIGLSNSAGMDVERTERFYEKLGLTRVGGIFLKL